MQHQQYAQVSRSQGRGKPCPYHTRISWFLLYMVGATARVALEACQRGGAGAAGAAVPPPLAGPYLFRIVLTSGCCSSPGS